MHSRPDPSEYAPYAEVYVSRVPDGNFVEFLEAQTRRIFPELRAVTEQQSLLRYAPGKWSLRESFLHVVDAERIFTYRALRIARNDQTDLPGFEQDDYIAPSEAADRTWSSIIDELQAVRASTIQLFRNLPAAAWTRTGSANGRKASVRGLAYITAGHVEHHISLLHERYLPR